MKPRTSILRCLLAAILTVAAAGPLALFGAPPAAPAKVEMPQSVFVMPSNPSEGRDPFFPNSTRVYSNNAGNQIRGASLSDLTLRSILGDPPRVFAIINNHTFAAGDDEDVLSKTGQRLHVRCVDINPSAGTATVEADGMTETLHLADQP